MRDQRPLTHGETELARTMFGDSIELGRVRSDGHGHLAIGLGGKTDLAIHGHSSEAHHNLRTIRG